jgi:DNA repair exonuclease SbcCD ATPase subunit
MTNHPYEEDWEKAKNALQNLYECRDNLSKELSWYKKTNPSVLQKTIQSLTSKQKEHEASRQSVNRKIDGNQNEIKQLPIKSTLNPANWFNAEQKELQQKRSALLRIVEELRQQLQTIDEKLDANNKEMRLVNDELQRHNTFEHEKCKRDIDDLAVKIREKEKEVREKKLNSLKQKRQKAQEYQSRLNGASNNYEKAKIHEACQNEFGDGSPGRLVSKFDYQISELENKISGRWNR